MSRRRQERVTELIHQEVSKAILHIKAPGLGFITVVAVRLSPDFSQARVYYSVLGSEDERQRTQIALDRAKSFFRSELRRLESLKNPPELAFILDNSAEEAQKILGVLSNLEKERDPAPPKPHPAS
ncbi:MAG: 30S ribosome-binding factor RbfA [Elusimicrobiota bacterium]|jgi:ribosome-binding factor A